MFAASVSDTLTSVQVETRSTSAMGGGLGKRFFRAVKRYQCSEHERQALSNYAVPPTYSRLLIACRISTPPVALCSAIVSCAHPSSAARLFPDGQLKSADCGPSLLLAARCTWSQPARRRDRDQRGFKAVAIEQQEVGLLSFSLVFLILISISPIHHGQARRPPRLRPLGGHSRRCCSTTFASRGAGGHCL